MPPLRLSFSRATMSYMTASSIAFFLSSTQALCAQLQSQKSNQQISSKPESPAASTIFIVTNRKPRGGTSRSGFSAERANSTSYFTANSRIEGMFASSISTNRKFDQQPKVEFIASLKAARDRSPSRKIAIFVHGYNSDIKVPLKLANTLSEEINMPVVLFAWPSKRNPFTYTEDECNAEWSAFHLEHFFEDMQREFGNDNIILVGHSLGCRVICWALQRFQSATKSDVKYGHIFFCSPDIDEQIFKMNIPMLERASSSTKVYASTRDIRLNFSQVLHGNPRLGLLKTSTKTNTKTNNKANDKANDKSTASNDESITAEKNESRTGQVEIIDYTRDDHSLFGHAIPFKLIAASVQR